MVVAITVRGPEWFFGLDSLFEGFSTIALLLVTLLSFKAYKFTKDKKYRSFAIAFGLMTIGMFGRALADFLVYMGAKVHPLYLIAGYAGYMGFTLVSLVVLFALTLKAKQRTPFVALLLVSLCLILFSASYRLSFHAVAFILVAFIALHFIKNYFQKQSLSAGLVCISFILFGLTQLAFATDILAQKFYIVGHLLRLLAFGLLFIALFKVLRK